MSSVPASSPNTMTLRDIADLCGVERAVVSMWRRRPSVRGRVVPFPTPVAEHGGAAHFDAAEVAAYLQETGRGNNPDAAEESLGWAVPPDAELEDLVVLLCLRYLAGEELTSADLAAIVAEHDPQDLFLGREAASVDMGLFATIEDLYSSSYGCEDALNRLMRGRAGREHRSDELTVPGLALLDPVLRQLLIDMGIERVELVDSSEGESSAVIELAAALGRPFVIEGNHEGARAGRRRALLRGVLRMDGLTSVDGGPKVLIDSFLGLEPAAALDRLDRLIMSLGAEDLGFVLGPAAVLTDPLSDPALAADRDQMLRAGYLGAAVRMPRTIYRRASRQAQALWLVRNGSAHPGVIGVADLSDLRPAEIRASDLGVDLVAALAAPEGHHFAYLRGVRQALVLAGAGVVTRGARQLHPLAPPEPDLRVRQLVDGLNKPSARLDTVLRPPIDPAARPKRQRSLADLRTRGEALLLRGNRLRHDWATPDGTVAVVPLPGWEGLKLDPLDLERLAPRARRTEPGDVVFTSSPPAAWVERDGGRLVPMPARILRLRASAPFGPYTVAEQINALPPTASERQSWLFQVSSDPDLEARLELLAAERQNLARRLAEVDELARLLTTADPHLTIAPHPHDVPTETES